MASTLTSKERRSVSVDRGTARVRAPTIRRIQCGSSNRLPVTATDQGYLRSHTSRTV